MSKDITIRSDRGDIISIKIENELSSDDISNILKLVYLVLSDCQINKSNKVKETELREIRKKRWDEKVIWIEGLPIPI